MEKTVIFIHGMFVHPQSWKAWEQHFTIHGYQCLAPPWPYHDNDPAVLRAHIPRGLAELSLEKVLEYYRKIIRSLSSLPVLIGHSEGGLIVQMLLAEHLGELGVCIASVPPDGLFSAVPEFLKDCLVNTAGICRMTSEIFHDLCCNTMTREASDRTYLSFAIPGSIKVLHDCFSSPPGLDFNKPHAPLLFVSAEKDRMIRPDAVLNNYRAYRDEGSFTDYMEFPGRSHCMIGEPGWEEVMYFVMGWVDRNIIFDMDTYQMQHRSSARRYR